MSLVDDAFLLYFYQKPEKGTKTTCAPSGATFVQGSKSIFWECKRII